jgi:hypothetical protein
MKKGLILETIFSSMELVPINDTRALFSANVSIVIDQLLGNRSQLDVGQVKLRVELLYLPDGEDDSGAPVLSADGGVQRRRGEGRELVIGYMETDKPIVPTSQHGAVVNITIDQEYLQIEGEQVTANFIQFILDFIQKPNRTVSDFLGDFFLFINDFFQLI